MKINFRIIAHMISHLIIHKTLFCAKFITYIINFYTRGIFASLFNDLSPVIIKDLMNMNLKIMYYEKFSSRYYKFFTYYVQLVLHL